MFVCYSAGAGTFLHFFTFFKEKKNFKKKLLTRDELKQLWEIIQRRREKRVL